MKGLFLKSCFLLLLAAAGCCCGKGAAETKKIIIDVRTPEEYRSGYLAGAVNLPHTQIAEKISSVTSDKSAAIYLYCRSGRRVGVAMETLKKMGYTRLHDLGGFENARRQLGVPVEMPGASDKR